MMTLEEARDVIREAFPEKDWTDEEIDRLATAFVAIVFQPLDRPAPKVVTQRDGS